MQVYVYVYDPVYDPVWIRVGSMGAWHTLYKYFLFQQNIVDFYKIFILFQINETVTAFLSGGNDPRRILTFDWATMEYTKHTSRLIGERRLSACSLLKGSDGEVLVAIASGVSFGMEVWNPANGSVQMLTSDFPPRTSEFPQLISVNDHSELIFYESYYPSQAKGIDIL
jgi:hypothetical protein